MKSVSIQDLKRHLLALIDEASSGVRILITRHKKPVAFLDSADRLHLHVGKHFGNARLVPLLRSATRGRYLDVLTDDRRGNAESS